ncbi:hypothetical protein C7B76_09080 [filamentous cyanobacterium CCP2]|nr:hypothetical protein C7B76_09080 [filamentous cyanobacterium CCP2]
MLEALRSSFGLRWTQFSWGVYRGLANPWMVTLALLVFIGIVLLASSPHSRRFMLRTAFILLGGYWFMISPLFSIPATQLLVRFLPNNTGETADTVVVLSRGREAEGDRYNTAISLVETGQASQLFITGRNQIMRVFESLQQRELPTEQFFGTTCARTTKQEAYSAASILFAKGINNIILITDPPHMLRAWLTFRSLGFSVTPYIEPLPDETRQSTRSLLTAREYLGLLSYALLGRFNQRSSNSLAQIAEELAADYPPEQCAITADRIHEQIAQH